MSEPRYLGLDLGTNTGWALVEGNKIISSGIRLFTLKDGEHKGKRGLRFFNFLVGIGKVDEIYYELVQFSGARKGGGAWAGDGGELYKGLLMIVNMYAAGWNVPVIGVHNGTLKKDFAGHGQAEKKDMCRIAHQMGWQGGTPGTDDMNDEVDAIALVVTQLKKLYNIEVSF